MAKSRHVPERTCVACGVKSPKQDLVRVVRSPQGEVRVDPGGKGAGRGAYLCRNPHCWDKGVYKGGLQRGLRAPLSPQDQEHLMSFRQQLEARQSSMES